MSALQVMQRTQTILQIVQSIPGEKDADGAQDLLNTCIPLLTELGQIVRHYEHSTDRDELTTALNRCQPILSTLETVLQPTPSDGETVRAPSSVPQERSWRPNNTIPREEDEELPANTILSLDQVAQFGLYMGYIVGSTEIISGLC